MESYVVRVYRRRSGAKRQLVGVLEGPRLVGSQAFSSVEELWEILSGNNVIKRANLRAKPAEEHGPRPVAWASANRESAPALSANTPRPRSKHDEDGGS